MAFEPTACNVGSDTGGEEGEEEEEKKVVVLLDPPPVPKRTFPHGIDMLSLQTTRPQVNLLAAKYSQRGEAEAPELDDSNHPPLPLVTSTKGAENGTDNDDAHALPQTTLVDGLAEPCSLDGVNTKSTNSLSPSPSPDSFPQADPPAPPAPLAPPAASRIPSKQFSPSVVNTAFFEACIQGNLQHVDVLINTFGANPRHATSSGIGAIHAAALEGHFDIVK